MKTRLFLSIAAVAAVALSCQKENTVITPEESSAMETCKEVGPNPNFAPTKSMTFVGSTDDEVNAETKTSLDGTSIKWAASEGIYLFDGVAPRAFASTNTEVAQTVTFEGSASVVSNYWSVYPSGTLSIVDSKIVISTTIPTYQKATGNSFAPKSNVAVAYCTSEPSGVDALKFKNIGAVVKFKLHANNTNVRKVRLDAINGEDLSGDTNVTFEADGSFSYASDHAKSESCVILESDTDLDVDKTYYIAVKSGTYSGGFRITLYKADGSFRSIKNTEEFVLDRNDLMDFSTLPEIKSGDWKSRVTDVLTRSTTGVTSGSTTYTAWSDKQATSSAQYAGKSAGGNDAIQLRSTNGDEGIVMTASGGKVSKVEVVWQANTQNGRTLDIYGKQTAYDNASDLFNVEKQGTKLGSIVKGTSTELSISGDYTFIGMRSNSGAMYLSSVSITVGESAPSDPIKLIPSTVVSDPSPTSVENTDGSSTFTVTSNVPWTIASNQSFASVSVSGNTVTVDFDNLPSGSRSATITVKPSEGEPISKTISQGAEEYTLYSGVLVEGDYIITYDNSAMNTTIDSDRIQFTSVTPVSNKITAPDASIVWHIAQSGDYWTIYNEGVNRYAAGTGAKNKAQLLESGTDNKSLWSCVSDGESTTYDFVNKQNSSNSVNANLRKNGSYGFACYGSGTGGALTLYKK